MTVPGSPRRTMRPKQVTPAERAVVFAAEQARLKQEAADRRAAKEAAAQAKPARTRRRPAA